MLKEIVFARYGHGTLFEQYMSRKLLGSHETIIGTDTDPYLFRRSPSLGAYKTERDSIVGGTVAWNQLADTTYMHASGTESDVVFTKDGGKLTVSGTASANIYARVCGQYTPTSGHKMLYIGAPSEIANVTFYDDSAVRQFDGKTTYALINASGVKIDFKMRILSGRSVNGTVIPQIFDLTQMFGSAIADYIYTLEQGTAGSGVAFFRKYFGADYYPYDSGSIRSVEGLVSHDMVRKNQLDRTGEKSVTYINADGDERYGANWYASDFISVLPSTTYTFEPNSTEGDAARHAFYDGSKQFIRAISSGKRTFSTPSNCAYMRFSYRANSTDVQLEIGSTATDYEPYEKHSYPLDSTVTLRGLLKLEDGKLKADGDIYKASGEVVRNWGERAYQSGDESLADAITDGTTTVYKLTTPTTEQAQPFAKNQKVSPSGTEEYVSTSVVPVGHNTEYYG